MLKLQKYYTEYCAKLTQKVYLIWIIVFPFTMF